MKYTYNLIFGESSEEIFKTEHVDEDDSKVGKIYPPGPKFLYSVIFNADFPCGGSPADPIFKNEKDFEKHLRNDRIRIYSGAKYRDGDGKSGKDYVSLEWCDKGFWVKPYRYDSEGKLSSDKFMNGDMLSCARNNMVGSSCVFRQKLDIAKHVILLWIVLDLHFSEDLCRCIKKYSGLSKEEDMIYLKNIEKAAGKYEEIIKGLEKEGYIKTETETIELFGDERSYRDYVSKIARKTAAEDDFFVIEYTLDQKKRRYERTKIEFIK